MRRGMHYTRFLLALAFAGAAAACNEDGTVRINSIKFNGVKSVDVSVLRSVLATKEDAKVPLLGVRLPWSRSRNAFDRTRFDADLQRIRAFYADRGFPDARVVSFDVKLNDKQDAVDVSLTVDEGTPVRVQAVNYVGFEVVPPAHLEDLQKHTLGVGKPRNRQAVITAHEAAVNELRDHGYPYARVATAEDDGPDGKQATITFTAEPGVLTHYGDVTIVGNSSVSDDVIRRQLTVRRGDLYRRSRVQDTQRRLYSMELFQFVNVEPVSAEQQNPEVPLRVTVAEGRHQRINGGIGYGTEEKARVDGEYRHVNFLGGARSFGAHGRWSSRDRGVRLDFNQPYVFSPRLAMGGEGQRWYTYTPAYNSVVTGAKLSFVRRQSGRTSWTVFGSSEKNLTSISDLAFNDPLLATDLIALGLDPDTQKQEGTLGAVGIDFQHTATDSVLDARRGYQVGVHVEQAGRLLPGTFNYTAISADARLFIPIGDDIVIANRLQMGNIQAAGGDPRNVPFAKKYFLGGATSNRGWGRFEVSPLSTSGLPIGGNTMIGLSSELRARLKGNFGGVLFIDSGNVWTNQSEVDGVLRTAAGIGLRYATPVGPIRLDFGYQLNPMDGLSIRGQPETRRWRVHFSIGQAF